MALAPIGEINAKMSNTFFKEIFKSELKKKCHKNVYFCIDAFLNFFLNYNTRCLNNLRFSSMTNYMVNDFFFLS